jgi:hypothetical protein
VVKESNDPFILLGVILIIALVYYNVPSGEDIFSGIEESNYTPPSNEESCTYYNIGNEYRLAFGDTNINAIRDNCTLIGEWRESGNEMGCYWNPSFHTSDCSEPGIMFLKTFCEDELYGEWTCTNDVAYVGCLCNEETPDVFESVCDDTDSGNDVWVKGICTDGDSSITDMCPLGDFTDYVSESWCSDGVCMGVSFDCSVELASCYQGRCIKWSQDSDNDGWSDLDEYEQGTDPQNGNDYPGAVKIGTIFVTNAKWSPAMGGLSGMDAKCQFASEQESLYGTWKALASDSATDAKNRIPDTKYIRIDGVVVADNKVDMFDGGIDNAINRNEKNELVDGAVWTGTSVDGTYSGNSCNDWKWISPNFMASSGLSDYVSGWWISSGAVNCEYAGTSHLYCIKVS